jgi:hypothetical protein
MSSPLQSLRFGDVPPWGRYKRLSGVPPLFRGLGRLGDDSTTVPVDLSTVIPWLLLGGIVFYSIGALRNRPKKSKRRAAHPGRPSSSGAGLAHWPASGCLAWELEWLTSS